MGLNFFEVPRWVVILALFWYLHGWIFPTGTCMGGQKLYTVRGGTWMGLTSYTVVHGWVTFPSKLVHGWVMGGGTSKFPEAHPYPDQSWVPPPPPGVVVISQIGILTPDWSIAAVPCYSREWKIAFGVNDEANKIIVCNKIISWNNFLFKNIINNDILQLCLKEISLY